MILEGAVRRNSVVANVNLTELRSVTHSLQDNVMENALVSLCTFWPKSDLLLQKWEDEESFGRDYQKFVSPLLELNSTVEWIRVTKVNLAEDSERLVQSQSNRMYAKLCELLKIPRSLCDLALTTRSSLYDVFGKDNIFIVFRVHGRIDLEIDMQNFLSPDFWEEKGGRFAFGVFEEQVSLAFLPLTGTLLTTHERPPRESFENALEKFEAEGSLIRKTCDASVILYAMLDGAIDAAFPVIQLLSDVLLFLESALQDESAAHSDDVIEASGYTLTKVMGLIQRMRMNHWQIREIITELRQNEYQALSVKTIELLDLVFNHIKNNVEVMNKMLAGCDEINKLRAQKLAKKIDKTVDYLTAVSLVTTPLAGWCAPFSVGFDSPIYNWEFSYLIWWIVLLLTVVGIVWVWYSIEDTTDRVGEVRQRLEARMAEKEKEARRPRPSLGIDMGPRGLPIVPLAPMVWEEKSLWGTDTAQGTFEWVPVSTFPLNGSHVAQQLQTAPYDNPFTYQPHDASADLLYFGGGGERLEKDAMFEWTDSETPLVPLLQTAGGPLNTPARI